MRHPCPRPLRRWLLDFVSCNQLRLNKPKVSLAPSATLMPPDDLSQQMSGGFLHRSGNWTLSADMHSEDVPGMFRAQAAELISATPLPPGSDRPSAAEATETADADVENSLDIRMTH